MSKVTTGILSAKGLTIGGIAAVTVAAGVTTGVVLHNKHNGDNDKNVPASQTQDENNTSDVVGSNDKKSKDAHEDLVERAIKNEKKTEVAQAVGDIANSGFDQHDTLVAKAVTGDQTVASILKDTETTKIGDKQLVAIVGDDTKSILDTQTPIADAGDTNKGKIGDNINVIPTDNSGGDSSSPTHVPNTPSNGVKDDQGGSNAPGTDNGTDPTIPTNPTNPSDGGSVDPTTPGDGGTTPTTPTNPSDGGGTTPTNPTNPSDGGGTAPTNPSDGGGTEPTQPGDGGTTPTNPGDGGTTKPTNPDDGTTTPTNPTNPTNPGDGGSTKPVEDLAIKAAVENAEAKQKAADEKYLELTGVLKDVTNVTTSAMFGSDHLTELMGEYGKTFEDAFNAKSQLDELLQKFNNGTMVDEERLQYNEQFKVVQNYKIQLEDKLEAFNKAMDQYNGNNKANIDKIRSLVDKVHSTNTEYQSAVDDLNKAYKDAKTKDVDGKYGDRLSKVAKSVEDNNFYRDDLNDQSNSLDADVKAKDRRDYYNQEFTRWSGISHDMAADLNNGVKDVDGSNPLDSMPISINEDGTTVNQDPENPYKDPEWSVSKDQVTEAIMVATKYQDEALNLLENLKDKANAAIKDIEGNKEEYEAVQSEYDKQYQEYLNLKAQADSYYNHAQQLASKSDVTEEDAAAYKEAVQNFKNTRSKINTQLEAVKEAKDKTYDAYAKANNKNNAALDSTSTVVQDAYDKLDDADAVVDKVSRRDGQNVYKDDLDEKKEDIQKTREELSEKEDPEVKVEDKYEETNKAIGDKYYQNKDQVVKVETSDKADLDQKESNLKAEIEVTKPAESTQPDGGEGSGAETEGTDASKSGSRDSEASGETQKVNNQDTTQKESSDVTENSTTEQSQSDSTKNVADNSESQESAAQTESATE
ncbi:MULTISPECIES: hypothetical protein [Bacillus amyloliquefaciens group]|uniref:hypothetical protein n=1 Tax=Bacillus amyloliquefaciens group TaxID=1938374 RepID=UPI00073BDFC5|nr:MULTISPECIES: hypothetical protein [Bacillus amyloliquefaciens group]KTF59770.1 hypothetical protein AR691_13635 [Bacillus amyloliquefaciens]